MERLKLQTVKILAITALLFNITVIPALAQQSIIERMRTPLAQVHLPGAGENADTGVQLIIGNIINAFLGLFGVFFLVLMIYGGYRWMNARGNESELDTAKGIIRSAIIGFVLVFLAYAISLFVTNAIQTAALPKKGA